GGRGQGARLPAALPPAGRAAVPEPPAHLRAQRAQEPGPLAALDQPLAGRAPRLVAGPRGPRAVERPTGPCHGEGRGTRLGAPGARVPRRRRGPAAPAAPRD